MRIIVTGADGFIGRVACQEFERRGHRVTRLTRESGDLVSFVGWGGVLDGHDAVLHLAGRAHVMRELEEDSLQAFRNVNLRGTAALADAAAVAGVSRFVFVSSIGVYGLRKTEQPLTEDDVPRPQEPYAVSKLEAERYLWEVAARHDMKLVVVRPPLVYGPGVRGNMLRLLKLVAKGVPLPLGSLLDQRSFIGVRNLCSLLSLCTESSAADNQIFVAADGEDVSVADLLSRIGFAMGRRRTTFKFPLSALTTLARLAGRAAALERMALGLRIDASKAREVLHWRPEIRLDDEVQSMVKWFGLGASV